MHTLSLHTWVSLPTNTRNEIRRIFNIPRSSNTIVSDGRIETDGVTNEDMEALTIEKMQSYLEDTSTDFHKLFDKVVEKVSTELDTFIVAPNSIPVPVINKPKRKYVFKKKEQI